MLCECYFLSGHSLPHTLHCLLTLGQCDAVPITRSPGAPIYFHLLFIMLWVYLVSGLFFFVLSLTSWVSTLFISSVSVFCLFFFNSCVLFLFWVLNTVSVISPMLLVFSRLLLFLFFFSLFSYFSYSICHFFSSYWHCISVCVPSSHSSSVFSLSKTRASSPLLCKYSSPVMTSFLISNIAIYLTTSSICLVLNFSLLPTEGRGKRGRRYLREVTHYPPWLHLLPSSLTSCTFHPYMVSPLSPTPLTPLLFLS